MKTHRRAMFSSCMRIAVIVGGLREDEFRVELDVNEANDHE